MNYYEHHIGDYAKDAGHLSMVEDGAYRRLLDAYYGREKPLPVKVKDCCKLARATTKAERDAVAYVLEEFFELRADGHYQKRCDEEIARFQGKQDDRDQQRKSEAERQRRHRERRKELFEALREHGEIPKYDTPTGELETLLSRVTGRDVTQQVTRDATATQTPDTRHQSPDPSTPPDTSAPTEITTGIDTHRARVTASPTAAGEACKAMRAAGLVDTNPNHLGLVALLEKGITTAQCAYAAKTAVRKRKGFAYALGVLHGQLADAGNTGPGANRNRNASTAAAWLADNPALDVEGDDEQ